MKNNKFSAHLIPFFVLVAIFVFVAGFGFASAKNILLAENDENDSESSAVSKGLTTAPGIMKKVEGDVEEKLNEAFRKVQESSPEATPLSVSIGPQGQARITNGSVMVVNGNMLMVSAFGINFSVDSSNAKITGVVPLPPLPSTATSSPTSTTTAISAVTVISVGDRVVVQGTVDSSSGIIKASVIRDLSAQVQSKSHIVNRINQLLEMINQLRAKLGL